MGEGGWKVERKKWVRKGTGKGGRRREEGREQDEQSRMSREGCKGKKLERRRQREWGKQWAD